VGLINWQQLVGELRSMAITIPAAIGLFSVLQEALTNKSPCGKRVRLTKHTQEFLADFKWIALDVSLRPTQINGIVPDTRPSTQGAGDAYKKGMGGVHFFPLQNGQLLPLLWRATWPQKIQDRLVSHDNESGDVTNSEYELAASVAQFDVLAQCVDIHQHTVHNLSDNSATVAWQRKIATSTIGTVRYLLQLQAPHQRHHRYFALHDFIPGIVNVMADRCSRMFHLTDTELLSYFNSHFPQTMPWQLYQLRKETSSALISTLCRRKPKLALLLNEPRQRMRIGSSGIFLSLPQH
jgi:hypothetical protein